MKDDARKMTQEELQPLVGPGKLACVVSNPDCPEAFITDVVCNVLIGAKKLLCRVAAAIF